MRVLKFLMGVNFHWREIITITFLYISIRDNTKITKTNDLIKFFSHKLFSGTPNCWFQSEITSIYDVLNCNQFWIAFFRLSLCKPQFRQIVVNKTVIKKSGNWICMIDKPQPFCIEKSLTPLFFFWKVNHYLFISNTYTYFNLIFLHST